MQIFPPENKLPSRSLKLGDTKFSHAIYFSRKCVSAKNLSFESATAFKYLRHRKLVKPVDLIPKIEMIVNTATVISIACTYMALLSPLVSVNKNKP